MRNSRATLLLAAATACCAGSDAAGGADLQQPVAPDNQQAVSVTRLASGADPLTYYSGITDATRLVVRDAATWAATWRRIWSATQPAPPLPPVDFQGEMVIVAGLGSRPSGGHSIAVESAYREGTTLHIVVRTETPGSSCLLSTALTAPVDVARVPRADDVRFRDRNVTRSC
jgi:hypothetical protein